MGFDCHSQAILTLGIIGYPICGMLWYGSPGMGATGGRPQQFAQCEVVGGWYLMKGLQVIFGRLFPDWVICWFKFCKRFLERVKRFYSRFLSDSLEVVYCSFNNTIFSVFLSVIRKLILCYSFIPSIIWFFSDWFLVITFKKCQIYSVNTGI